MSAVALYESGGASVVANAPQIFLARLRAAARDERVRRRSRFWLQAFVLVQIGCQLALISGGFDSLRMFIRIAVFGTSLFALVMIPGRAFVHPSIKLAVLVLAIVIVSIFHPTTNNFVSGTAQAILYLSILAPLFWVPRLRISTDDLRRVIIILWVFHSCSAGVGVLQVYYPGQFQPNLSSVYSQMDEGYVESLQVTLASGERIFRPMGLTDTPGGAATAGFYAVLFGMGLFLNFERRWLKALCLVSIMLGMIAIYMSQVRVTLIMMAICIIGFCAMLVWRKRFTFAAPLLIALAVIIFLSFTAAATVGGDAFTERMSSLVEASPSQVYYKNRGKFVEHTITELLPEYPLGAGLGRWGMMAAYFSDNRDPRRAPLYAEVQWTGWLLDGGVLLILAYVGVLAVASLYLWKIVRDDHFRREELWLWAALILAYNVGIFAVTFSYPIFVAQGGLEFWFLNAALFTCARTVANGREANREAKG